MELVWGEQLWAVLTDLYFQSLPHVCSELGTVWLVLAALPPEAVVRGSFSSEEHGGAGTLVFTLGSDELHSRIGLSIPQVLGFVWQNHAFLPIAQDLGL